MDERSTAAVHWLLSSREPAVRLLTRRDVLGEPAPADAAEVLDGPWVRALLSGQDPDGGFGVHPYRKWTGAYWRLVSLGELAVPEGEPRALAALEQVLAWRRRARRYARPVDGRVRICASMDGNTLAACCRLGLAGGDEAREIVDCLLAWQWPDGGWNCDRRPPARRSSFHETLATALGLHLHAEATGDGEAARAAGRAAELFLEHRLFRRLATGEVIDRTWLVPRYPPYWHYDLLQVLLVLSRMGRVGDPRALDGIDELERQRLPDGRWAVTRRWWNPPEHSITPDAVDWGRSGPNEMVTLNALRVLRAAGRLG